VDVLPQISDYDTIADQLQKEIEHLWSEYQKAPPERKAALRGDYVAALRRFSAHVNLDQGKTP
jgi:hypothetical protein